MQQRHIVAPVLPDDVEPDGVKTIRSPSFATFAAVGFIEELVPNALFEAVMTRGEPVIAVPEPGADPPATDGMIAIATEQSVVNAP